jgi:hypothetical protein
MRHDEMLRLSLECARAAVRGEDFAGPLATGIEQILRVDAGVVVLTHHLTTDRVIDGIDLGSSASAGGPTLDVGALQEAAAVAHRHPGYAPQRFFSPHVDRLSDLIPIGPFRETDVWAAVHATAITSSPPATRRPPTSVVMETSWSSPPCTVTPGTSTTTRWPSLTSLFEAHSWRPSRFATPGTKRSTG